MQAQAALAKAAPGPVEGKDKSEQQAAVAAFMAMATVAGALQQVLHEAGAQTVMADTVLQFAASGAVSVNVKCYAEAPACLVS